MINIFNKIVTVKGKISEVNIEGSTTGQGASNYTSTFLIENQKVSFHTCFYPYFHFSNNEELIISGVLVYFFNIFYFYGITSFLYDYSK